MKKQTLYLGNYFDKETDDYNYILFVADYDCDTLKEMKNAYRKGEKKKISNIDISKDDIWPITAVSNYKTGDVYSINPNKQ